jgi:ABC-type transporter Mla subunit MlaD
MAIIETKLEEHSRLLEKQQERNETQTELNTILKTNAEQMRRFGETLDRINDNLSNLNNNQQKLNENQLELGERVDQIETTLQEQKIDPIKLFKSILSYIVTGIGSIAIAYILWKLGISNNN